MKRDMDLVRRLVRIIESAELGTIRDPQGVDVYDARVQYHLRLLVDAGLARCVGTTTEGNVSLRLTWQGHEFLELSQNEPLWEQAKRYVSETTGGLSASALRSILERWQIDTLTEEQTLEVRPRRARRVLHKIAPTRRPEGRPAVRAGVYHFGPRTRESFEARPEVRVVAPQSWDTRYDRPWEPVLGGVKAGPEKAHEPPVRKSA